MILLTLFKGEDLTSKQFLISAHILSPEELSSTLTSLPATHQRLEKGLSEVKPYVFLEQTRAKSFVENITQFKTRLRARDYPNSLVERIKNNVRSQMKGSRHFNKERQCGKKNLPFVTTYHPALPNFKKWHLIKNQPLLKRPSHVKRMLANSCWYTQIGVCERHNNMLAHCWRQIELVSILAKFLPTVCQHVVVLFTYTNLSLPTPVG